MITATVILASLTLLLAVDETDVEDTAHLIAVKSDDGSIRSRR